MALADGLIRVLVCREGDLYVAQCLEVDIGAEARDIDTLRARLSMALRAEHVLRGGTEDDPFPGIGEAPRFFHEKWDSCEFRSDPTPVPGIDHGAAMKMAMCA